MLFYYNSDHNIIVTYKNRKSNRGLPYTNRLKRERCIASSAKSHAKIFFNFFAVSPGDDLPFAAAAPPLGTLLYSP